MNKEKAAKEAIQMHLDAGQKIREGLQRELSARQGTAQVKAAAPEKPLVEMQAQAADEKASMGQAAEEQLQAMQQQQFTVAEALKEQLSKDQRCKDQR